MSAPKVFISYSHDTPEHKGWVLQLATDLRKNGVDATLDQWDLALGEDVVAYMHKGIAAADRVIMVCSEEYLRKAEQGLGEVGFERLIVTAEMVQSIDTKKFIPLFRNNRGSTKIPSFLGPRMYIDFSADELYPTNLERLSREILGTPALSKPALGSNPFSGFTVQENEPARIVSPTGFTNRGERMLDDKWFHEQHEYAARRIGEIERTAFMELRFGLHEQISKSQVELLTSVRKAEIHTFGWPIAVTLENNEAYRPRPYGDGIRAEISINDPDRRSYDYWAARRTGDFFLLQSLFEDQRQAKNQVYFNTRIVRVTESLLFAANFYSKLGLPPETRVSIRVLHHGLINRTLVSSSPNRSLSLPRTSKENVSEAETVVAVGEIRVSLVESVERILAPLFMLFDFMEFTRDVYEDIVRRFERGEVS